MFGPYQTELLVVVTAIQLLVPAYFMGKAIAHGKLRVRFTLRCLLWTVTLVAVSLGIVRLPLPWPFKSAILWGFLMCFVGLAVGRWRRFPARP